MRLFLPSLKSALNLPDITEKHMTYGGVQKSGKGHMHFVLGQGPTGTAGYLDLTLQQMPLPGEVFVHWEVPHPVPEEVRYRIEQKALSLLRFHCNLHLILLGAIITEVRTDPVRQNDYERAVWWAIHSALRGMELPLPQIFAAPEDDPSWQEELAKNENHRD